MNIAVIPARGGSKRIPGKNIKLFCGKPIIAWSIEAAQKSKAFDLIIVSTDDSQIAEVARSYGALTPFVRPDHLSDDFTGTTAVIAHAVEWALEHYDVKGVCCIYATAPFIEPDDLVNSFKVFNTGNWSYVFSVTSFPAPIFRAFQISEEKGVKMFFPEHFPTRSQDLPAAFHDAAQFYWGTPEAWRQDVKIFGERSFGFELPSWRVQDIDTPEDWLRAEKMAKALLNPEIPKT